jgi:diguanylate cyclase (GGDEF)-like protein
VFFLDIDLFKMINDTMGHHVGDMLLQAVSALFDKIKHPEDFLGRLGGDEFALIIQRDLDDRSLYRTMEEYRNALKYVTLEDQKLLNVNASFGVAKCPRDSVDPIELLKFADTAMYSAKRSGKDQIAFFSPKMKDELARSVQMESLLKNALDNKELYMVFQPIFGIRNKELDGFEALTRWLSPVLGNVSPSEFIPVVENNGLIHTWGSWILKEACGMFMSIQGSISDAVYLAVNISANQIMEPEYLDNVQKILEETGMIPDRLHMEITESVFFSDIEPAMNVVSALRNLGIRIVLDDFGTGYSSLYLLQQLSIDALKIDRSCIQNLNDSEKNRSIATSIIQLAHKMGMSVVAEGVETENQLAFLKENMCDELQGFLWGKPSTLDSLDILKKKA